MVNSRASDQPAPEGRSWRWLLGAFCIAAILRASLWIGMRAGDFVVDEANRRPVALTAEDQVLLRYDEWKRAHSGSVGQLMGFYAPQVRIIREGGKLETYRDLQILAGNVRKVKTFDDVRDLKPPQVTIEKDTAVLQLTHRYGHSNPAFAPAGGLRRLKWRKINSKWMIIEDLFPQTYFSLQGPAPSGTVMPGTVPTATVSGQRSVIITRQ